LGRFYLPGSRQNLLPVIYATAYQSLLAASPLQIFKVVAEEKGNYEDDR
jgi:hypothetical protein